MSRGASLAPAGATLAPPAIGAAATLPLVDLARAREILDTARFRNLGVLLETEGMALIETLGIATPRRIELPNAQAAAALGDPPLAGERVVLKAVSPHLLHKTEVGAVSVVPNRRAAILAEIEAMERRCVAFPLAGFVLYEHVSYRPELGHELLLGLRWTRDFGPIVTLGPGGIHTELLASAFRDGEGVAVCSPQVKRANAVPEALARHLPLRLVTEPQRGLPAPLARAEAERCVRRMLELAAALCPAPIAELEINPLVVSEGRLVALDVLGTFSDAPVTVPAPRPLEKIRRLLEPRSIAIAGVSEKMNPGRIILQNVLRAGTDPRRVTVIKPGSRTIEGCACVPSLADLPGPVDLVVLSVAAPQAAEMVADIADHRRAESVILIPGGLEEKAGSGTLVGPMRQALAASRHTLWGGPVVNGGNCLGIRSLPGRYDTLFIPGHKLGLPAGAAAPVALITGSGAFACSKLNKLERLNPLYTVTIGNQMDLTVADYLTDLADDPRIELFAVYLEGFRTLDGARFLQAVERITGAGRNVILYLAGRTRAGASAAASHTAAVAGDHAVARALARSAHAIVADTLEDFEDLVRLFTRLHGRRSRGLRLGAVSNAGYESVAFADALGPFTLADFTPATQDALHAILAEARLAEIVGVRNPLDLTPILGDAGTEAVARAVLDDPNVDAAAIGCVPMTGALKTLPPGPGHTEDVQAPDSIAGRLVRLMRETSKPWVAVVDAGSLYDPMVRVLEDGGVPTFRTADRAMRLFGTWAERVR
jgi:acyl-CoA synthetase (NDP forming)